VLERVGYFCLFFLNFLTIWVKGINVIISKLFGNPILNHINLRRRKLLFGSWVLLVFILCSWKVANIKASFHLNYVHFFSLKDSYPSSIWNYKWRMELHFKTNKANCFMNLLMPFCATLCIPFNSYIYAKWWKGHILVCSIIIQAKCFEDTYCT